MEILIMFLALFGTEVKESKSKFFNPKIKRASYYHDKFVGRKTATGQVFKHTGMTGASNVLNLGDSAEVCNLEGYCIEILINDRTAPRFAHRIDLTKRAFIALAGDTVKGVIDIKVRRL